MLPADSTNQLSDNEFGLFRENMLPESGKPRFNYGCGSLIQSLITIPFIGSMPSLFCYICTLALFSAPWFPQNVAELDKCSQCVTKYEPTTDPRHPVSSFPLPE